VFWIINEILLANMFSEEASHYVWPIVLLLSRFENYQNIVKMMSNFFKILSNVVLNILQMMLELE
jgi:hypothetical protein